MPDDLLVLKPKGLRGEDGYKVFSVRVREDIVDDLDKLSNASGYSRNELIGVLLNYAIKRCVVEK